MVFLTEMVLAFVERAWRWTLAMVWSRLRGTKLVTNDAEKLKLGLLGGTVVAALKLQLEQVGVLKLLE